MPDDNDHALYPYLNLMHCLYKTNKVQLKFDIKEWAENKGQPRFAITARQLLQKGCR